MAGGRPARYPVSVRRLLATALTYALAGAVVAVSFPLALVLFLLTAPFDRRRMAVSELLRWLGEVLLRHAPLWPARIEGSLPPPPATFVVVPNHQSIVDAIAVACLPRNMKWLGKVEAFRLPWLGWAFHLAGYVPVKRGDRASGAAALGAMRRWLEAGVPVGLFAEGHRTRDGLLQPFHAGPFRLAVDLGVPIVPVAISGAWRAMPPDRAAIRPSTIQVRILPPVPTVGRTPADVDALREEVRGRIAAALAELEAPAAPPRAAPATPAPGSR
ncbi:1-acylglycerol-3-phosphate O-acyltransferase [Anaeromyxobacter sp. K]|nr:1-acylglycerol-3-phosphate O-acyltransferase [Anaeromyxobacter sp. K]